MRVGRGEVSAGRAYFVHGDDSVGGLGGFGCCLRRHCELLLGNERSIDSLGGKKLTRSVM
jgi:hypothetical protein